MPEDDDAEIEYGKWHVFDLAGSKTERERSPKLPDDIWPHWNEGVPTKLRRTLFAEASSQGRVSYKPRLITETLELIWEAPQTLVSFDRNSRRTLTPSGRQSAEWSGVYRLFSVQSAINRFCGTDETGTLYIGMAGAGKGNWSILRTRIASIVSRQHHAVSRLERDVVSKRYPWETLAIEWAFTGTRMDNNGNPRPAARMAEGWLLGCYRDSFGELPPLNDKG